MKGDRSRIQKEAVDRIKELNEWEPGRKFTQCELLGITGNTINALVKKGIIKTVEDAPFEKYGFHYYIWTGKELG